jgi:hypothetical protein
VPRVVQEAAAVATNAMNVRHLNCWLGVAVLSAMVSTGVVAQVLPEDRADALYHSYDGGGISITGPSLLLRKKVTKNISVAANYYVDSISSASIDVLTRASEYSEERTEYSLGVDYLLGETIISAGYGTSDENDFEAQSAWFGVSQDVFGGLTTVNLGYLRGWDTVTRSDDPLFSPEDVDRRGYRIGISQVLTKNLVTTFDFEGITDEGFLNNPYREVRYEAPGEPGGAAWELERYPNTRTSSAVSIGGRYFLAPRSAVYGSGRYFTDTWDIDAWNVTVGYVRPFKTEWLFDISYRYYTQTAAEFYSDLFAGENFQNFLARDKELSTFSSHSLKLDATYKFPVQFWDLLEKGTLNLSYNHIMFEYDDFRNALEGDVAGTEPFYDFSADVIQFYVSFWF